MGNGFDSPSLTAWTADIEYRAYPILLRPPIAQMVRRWYRNINLLSIAYAFRPRLRSRLTLSGTSLPQETLGIRWRDSHPSFATHTGILTSQPPPVLPVWLTALERSLPLFETVRSFGDTLSPGTFSAQSHSTSELLRTLEWWLLLSQHPDLPSNSTSFST